MVKTAVTADARFLLHLTGPGHVESPARAGVIAHALTDARLLSEENLIVPRFATKEEIALAHHPKYIELVEREAMGCDKICTLSTGDVEICQKSYAIATLAVGAVLNGVDAIFEKQFANVFCIVRPPGHHACRAQGMGFCLFNNVAIGALYALEHYPIKRVLIVDWDVHHGNGTQDIVQNDPRIFYFSTHQSPLYPGTGAIEENGCGNIMNVPITANPIARDHIFKAFHDLTLAMDVFKPELVLISAGFDAHLHDPLGGLNLIEDDYIELTHIVKEIAEKYAKGKIVSVLEGGYNLEALAKSAVAHVRALSE